MTREEAKYYLQSSGFSEEQIDTIEKAFTSTDAISRQYLLDNCVVDKVTMPYVPVSKIENAPPVNPQPKIGHWISHHHGCEYECSECHDKQRAKSKYCPNCGAKMIEPQERSGEE